MLKPVSEWNEAYILSLPKENNEFERKGSKKLDLTLPGVDENDVLNELAKQLCAFANTGGGKIIYGLKDDGSIDGGVSTEIKKGGTKEWLERQVAVVTDYEILGVVVQEIEGGLTDSQIQPSKAIYVIDVPDSERAPHQSRRDLRYYVRLNSQSQPASHRLIEDIRSRRNHPRVYLGEAKIENISRQRAEFNIHDVTITLRLTLTNDGPLKSTDTLLKLRPVQGHFDYRIDPQTAESVFGVKPGSYQWSLLRPVPPESDVSFRVIYHLNAAAVPNGWEDTNGRPIDDATIDWTVFADSAPPRIGP